MPAQDGSGRLQLGISQGNAVQRYPGHGGRSFFFDHAVRADQAVDLDAGAVQLQAVDAEGSPAVEDPDRPAPRPDSPRDTIYGRGSVQFLVGVVEDVDLSA